MTNALPILQRGSCEPFKACVHGTALGLAAMKFSGPRTNLFWFELVRNCLSIAAGLIVLLIRSHDPRAPQVAEDVGSRPAVAATTQSERTPASSGAGNFSCPRQPPLVSWLMRASTRIPALV